MTAASMLSVRPILPAREEEHVTRTLSILRIRCVSVQRVILERHVIRYDSDSGSFHSTRQ